MNKKYDYLKIVANFDKVQYKIYQVIIENFDDFCGKLHYAITLNVRGCAQIFHDTKSQFKEYLLEETDALEVTRFESYLISFLERNKKFSEFFNDREKTYINISTSLIRAFLNRTKNLKTNLNLIEMIYQNYVKYIHTNAGRSLIYDEDYQLENCSYYEKNTDTYESLNKCKKELISATGIGLVSNLIVSSLWDEMFRGRGRVNFKECERKVWEKFDKEKLPHSTLFLRMKSLYCQMLSNLLKLGLLNKYFDTSLVFNIDGKNYNIESAVELWLNQARVDYFYEKKSQNRSRINYIDLVDGVERFCKDKGIKYSTRLENPEALIALKCDSNFVRSKGTKLYFYKNGVWKDFKNNKSGYLTELIPKNYLS